MSDALADTAATDAPEAATTDGSSAPDTGADTGSDLAAEVEKWKRLARKHENQHYSALGFESKEAFQAAMDDIERVRREAMTDQQRAVEEARKAARAETLVEVGAARVDDAVRVAVVGRSVDVDALLDGLDRSKFLGEDGQPDRDAIKAWVERIAPEQTEPTTTTSRDLPELFDLGQGLNGTTTSDPLLTELKSALGI